MVLHLNCITLFDTVITGRKAGVIFMKTVRNGIITKGSIVFLSGRIFLPSCLAAYKCRHTEPCVTKREVRNNIRLIECNAKSTKIDL